MREPDDAAGFELRFRRMEPDDLRLMHEWLQRPHVRQWWSRHETYEEVVEHYLPAVTGDDPTDLYVVLLGEHPVGFVETYLVADYPDYAQLVGGGEGAAGVDLFVADAGLTGRGLGSEIIRRFVTEIVFRRSTVTTCVADPDVRNAASLRAFEKAGFRIAREFFDPSDRQTHALVRLDLAPMELGHPRTALRRKLVAAVLRGEKTATAGLRTDYEPHTDESLPRVGERLVVRGFDDEPVAIVETTEVRVVRAGDIDLAFAHDEGEGFATVADWRRAHEDFWADEEIDDDTLIVAERFRVIERLER